jgi:cob(I)alamin adenosyltransferase
VRIYTRTGDDGDTGLIGGSRVAKSHPLVEAYGTVDELNAVLGLAAVHAEPSLRDAIVVVQARLFDVGALLATPASIGEVHGRGQIDDSWVDDLERDIDSMSSELPQLRSFILPGGTPTAALLHLARTVCRRAERRVVATDPSELLDAAGIVTWLNRLSDWIFVAARVANHRDGVEDVRWQPSVTDDSTTTWK